MPAAVVLRRRSTQPVKITATGNRRRNRDRIAHLDFCGLGFRRHRKISDRSGKARWSIWRQRFYVEAGGVALDLYFARLGELAKWIRKKWIGERIIQVER